MKKVVRMLGLCALVALAFTACKNDDTQKVTFSASAVQPTSDARTHIDFGTFLVWDANDAIQIFNEDGNEMDFTVKSFSGRPGVALFTAETEAEVGFVKDLETKNYTAFYPNATVNADNKVVMEIPAEQLYVGAKDVDNHLYPMVGFNNGTDFQFQSNAGFLNVPFRALEENQTLYVDKVVLTSPDFLTGSMIYDKDGQNYEFVGTGHQITVTCEEPVDVIHNMARDFTFVLPEGALTNGFTIDVYLGDELLETYEAQAHDGANAIVAEQFRTMIDSWLPQPQPEAPTGK